MSDAITNRRGYCFRCNHEAHYDADWERIASPAEGCQCPTPQDSSRPTFEDLVITVSLLSETLQQQAARIENLEILITELRDRAQLNGER